MVMAFLTDTDVNKAVTSYEAIHSPGQSFIIIFIVLGSICFEHDPWI